MQHEAVVLKQRVWQALVANLMEASENTIGGSQIYTERILRSNVFNTTCKRRQNYNNSAGTDPAFRSSSGTISGKAAHNNRNHRHLFLLDSKSSISLNDQADLLRRSNLLLKSLVVWRRFSKVSKMETRIAEAAACNHSDLVLKKKSLQALKEHVYQCRP